LAIKTNVEKKIPNLAGFSSLWCFWEMTTTPHKKSCCRRSVEKEEAPVTVLSCWCLRWNHKKKGSIIIYGKRLVNGRVEERFWKTSSVVSMTERIAQIR